MKFDFALEKALSGANVKDPQDIIHRLNKDALKLSDDGIVGLKEQLEPLMQSHPYLFSEAEPNAKPSLPSGMRPSQPDTGVPKELHLL
jgi:hypothetical protein